AKDYLKKIAKDNAEAHSEIATTIVSSFASDPKAMKDAEDYAGQAAKLGESYEYYYTYAIILNQNGKKDQALDAAKAALEMVKDTDRASSNLVMVLIRKLQEG
ncbi:MAG: hypothetical protein KDD15_29185, partial [Lewinella sp.]|nr:hypothetical protein [Lewinella sp.]